MHLTWQERELCLSGDFLRTISDQSHHVTENHKQTRHGFTVHRLRRMGIIAVVTCDMCHSEAPESRLNWDFPAAFYRNDRDPRPVVKRVCLVQLIGSLYRSSHSVSFMPCVIPTRSRIQIGPEPRNMLVGKLMMQVGKQQRGS